MTIAVKICGLSDEISVRAVIESGADFVGFVHYPKSPRHVSIEKAAQLKSLLPESIKSVMVVVDPNDELLVEIASEMQPDYLQLHGNETPERLTEIRKKFPQIKIIKAVSVYNSVDIKKAEDFYDVCDFLLFDAKPTSGKMMHGGNGIAFDWNILAERQIALPWFLSGGLNSENIAQAIKISGAKMVDVSSGVESSPGVKDAGLIENFVKVVRGCN
ncbi:MAG: phosphoribosylanthranilate isomerase [Pseudomonadota bacterium]